MKPPSSVRWAVVYIRSIPLSGGDGDEMVEEEEEVEQNFVAGE